MLLTRDTPISWLHNHGGQVIDRVERGELSPSFARVGQVAASLRRSGRKPVARTFDAMIAATALAHDLPVHTCHPRDFAGIDDLTIVAVPHPDS